MEYQISWGLGGDTLIMPKQKDVIRGHILRYLTATSKDHVAIVDETLKALETVYANIDKEEAENFTDILGEIVSNILQDQQIAIDFYKKDRDAWAQYIGTDENLQDILSEYAEATSLYEVHVGSADYDRLRGQSGYKFGRDMQKLPKFDIQEFKRRYNLTPFISSIPLQLLVTVKKLPATSKRGTFEEAYKKAKRERIKQRKTLKQKYKRLSITELKTRINEILGPSNEIGVKEFRLMKERYEKGKVKTNYKNQLVNMALDLNTSIARNPSTKAILDKNISVTFKIISTKTSKIVYSVENQTRGIDSSLEALAQVQLDEKSRQIRDRGVVTGGWTSTSGTQIKFNKGMFERDDLLDEDEVENDEEDFEGEAYLVAETVNGNYKNITQFTFEDMIPVTFLEGKKETDTFAYDLNPRELLNQIIEDNRMINFLDFQVDEINKVTVNMLEIKFVLPAQDKTGITAQDGLFNQRQQDLVRRLKRIKTITTFQTAPVAEWDSNVYDTGARASRKMQEHLSLFKERVEELVDFYEVKITGEVDNMED